jgi:hypothetical protein
VGGSKSATPTLVPTATPTQLASVSPTPASPTATVPPATPTATRVPPTPTRTPTPSPTPSPTPLPTAPLGTVQPLDPNALPNYTLKMTFVGVNVPDATGAPQSSTLQLEIEQNAPDNYHMQLGSTGTNVEAWKVNGQTYVSQGGQITQAPADSGAELFSPSLFLQSTPALPASLGVQTLGTEQFDNRAVTHYRVPAGSLAAFFANGAPNLPALTKPAGAIDLWVDNQLHILLKATSNAAWTNPDGSAGTLSWEYLINAIGTTPTVAAPQ